MNIIKNITRILFGITFIFSGFVKGIDPWGSAYKFTDYFNAMGLDFLDWSAFPLGVLLAFAEFMIGVAFLFNWKMKLFSWLGLVFMGFFLPLTLWIAIKNPVTDCGCFGDALVISNWETFYKNLVLMVFAILAVRYRNDSPKGKYKKVSGVLSAISAVAYLTIVYISFNHLPVFDFRPYKTGVNIPEAMSFPIDAPQEIYANTFYYKNKNTGEIEEFTEDNYPWQDTANWEYSDMKSVLVQEGYEPPIHDFRIETPDGEDIIDFFIYDENYVFILVAYDLHKSNLKAQDKINSLANWALDENLSFICLTSTIFDDVQVFAEESGAPYEFFNCDEITLKTMIRSNPGLLLLKDGTIVEKWHFNDIPTVNEFREKYMNN